MVTCNGRLGVLYLLLVLPNIGERTTLAAALDPFGSGPGGADTPSQKVADKGPLIPQVQFTNNDISMAFQIISDATGWSIFPTSDTTKAKVSLWAKNISAADLLDKVIAMAGLTYHRDGDIIMVMTYEEYMEYYGLAKKILVLKYADANAIAGVIGPFLTKRGKCVVHKQTNSIVLYEADANLQLMSRIVESLDSPSDQVTIEVIDIKYADAEAIAKALKEILADKKSNEQNRGASEMVASPSSPSETTAQPAKPDDNNIPLTTDATVDAYAIGRTNQVILKGNKHHVAKALALIEQLDRYIESTTVTYPLSYVDVVEVFEGIRQALQVSGRFNIGGDKDKGIPVGVTMLEKTNTILLIAPPSAHRIIASVIQSVDIPAPYESGIIRVYKLDNADVDEVAATVRELIDRDKADSKSRDLAAVSIPEPGKAQVGQEATKLTKTSELTNQVEGCVSVSKSTNSVIIQAPARVHREMEKLIAELDKRRKQVSIKAMIVEVTTTDDLTMGAELSYTENNKVVFTPFGLSMIDPNSGVREVIVGPGGTAAILPPDRFRAVVEALQSNGNINVKSAPQLLVNDNAVGTINSIDEEPIKQVNASNTVATTSFAGFVEAGTQFVLTPHISEEGYLRVEYQIILNAFGAPSTDPSIPPARRTNKIASEATIPNGSTIVVGGLQTIDEKNIIDKVPVLGDIPLVGQAFRKTVVRKRHKNVYLFLTPSVMERDDFSDLKGASKEALDEIDNRENNSSSSTTDRPEK